MAVHGQADGATDDDVVERRLLVIHDHVVAAVLTDLGDDHRGHVLLDRLGHELRHLERDAGVEPAGLQRGQPRPALGDDRIADAVEIRPAGHEILGVSLEHDELAARILLELEGPGADAALTQLGQRHVGGIHGRIPRREHQDQRGLGPLEPEDHRVGVGRLDGLDVGVPVFPRAQAELGRRVLGLAHHVEGVLDVGRGEGLAVVPLHVLAEEEDEVAVAVLPRPALGQLGDDGLHALDRLERIEGHEIRVAGRHRPHSGDGGRLMDRESRRILHQHRVEDAAPLRRLADGWPSRRGERGDHGQQGDRAT